MPEQNLRHPSPRSPDLTKPVVDHLPLPNLDRDRSKQLALRVLCLAQRQYSLLQAANLLTPDMIAEFETLQQLVREENAEPGGEVSGEPGPARKAPLAQELRSESKSAGYSGPVTRTMARQLSGLAHTLGVPPGPDCTPPQASREATEKKRRRPSPSEPDSPPAPKLRTKRQRQSLLPCLKRGILPEARLPCGPSTPTGKRAPSPCPSPRFCPATVIKSRVPLGPSALQNCSTPLPLPSRDLNATFDLSEEPLAKLGFHECVGWDSVPQELNRLDQPFIPSAPMPLFTMKGPKPASSFSGTSARKKRRAVSSSISRSLGVARGRSRIARLPSTTLKRPAGPLAIPEPPSSPHYPGKQKNQEELMGVKGVLSAGSCSIKVS